MKAIFPLCFIIAADYVTWLKWSCEEDYFTSFFLFIYL